MSMMRETSGGPRIPSPQHHLAVATQKAVEDLRGQSREQLAWLGAIWVGGDRWGVPVPGDVLVADVGEGLVVTSRGEDVRPQWRILVLHYLAVRDRCVMGPPEVTFAHLPDGRGYASNYEGRVLRRLCATAGRDAGTILTAARGMRGRSVPGGTLAFDLMVVPRLTLRLIWEAGDEEFPPAATILLPGNIGEMLCVEDIVVLSEQVVSHLSGRGF